MSIDYQKKTTAEIKKLLQSKFNHKFSVTRDHGTASHWINVRWTDGPSESDIRSFCGSFNDRKNDDIMTDLWCGSQYTSESRTISPGAYIWAVRKVCDDYGIPYPTVKISGMSAYVEQDKNKVMSNNGGYTYLTDYIHRLLAKTDLKKLTSKDKEWTGIEGTTIIKGSGKWSYTEYYADMSIYRLDFNAAILDFEQIKKDFNEKEKQQLIAEAAEAQEIYGDDVLEEYSANYQI